MQVVQYCESKKMQRFIEALIIAFLRPLIFMAMWNYVAPKYFPIPEVYKNIDYLEMLCLINICYGICRIPVSAWRNLFSHEFEYVDKKAERWK